MSDRLLTTARISEIVVDSGGMRYHRAIGHVFEGRRATRYEVEWRAALRGAVLSVGAEVELWELREEVRVLGSQAVVDFIPTGELEVRDPATDYAWVVDVVTATPVDDPGAVPHGSLVAAQMAQASARLESEATSASTEGGWFERAVHAEAAGMDRALARAAEAALDLGAEFELVRHTPLSGGGGQSPFELRLITPRGTVSHRKTHKESWDEAVRALGLD